MNFKQIFCYYVLDSSKSKTDVFVIFLNISHRAQFDIIMPVPIVSSVVKAVNVSHQYNPKAISIWLSLIRSSLSSCCAI